MKTRFLIVIAAAMLAGTLSAQASNVDDTVLHRRYNFPQKITRIIVKGYSKVIIIPDKEEYIEPADPFRSTADADKIGIEMLGKDMDGVRIDAPAGIGKLMLHVIMEGAITITSRDFSQVTIGCTESNLQGLSLSTNDYSQATIHNLGNISRLTIWANDFSRVSMPANDKADTLQAINMAIRSCDHAVVLCNVPCSNRSTNLDAKDFSSIDMDFCKGEELKTNQRENSKVTVTHHNVKNTEFSYSGPFSVSDIDESFDTEEDPGKRGRYRFGKYDESDHPHHSNGASKISQEFNIRFLWGFHNWGSEPFNGLNGMIDANYALKTSFSSYQLEAMYYPCVWSRFRMGLGLGYESDVYKFASKHVVIDEGSPRTFIATPTDEDIHTQLVARYVTLPITVEWNNNDDFMLGLTVLSGLAVGDKHKIIYGKGSANDIVQKSNLLNPYKCDVRFAIGWRLLYAFLQVPLLPVNQDMTQDLYPMKFGFAINLGD